jgi:hypothetical protein
MGTMHAKCFPKSGHYLNITRKNLVKVFKKDTLPVCMVLVCL